MGFVGEGGLVAGGINIVGTETGWTVGVEGVYLISIDAPIKITLASAVRLPTAIMPTDNMVRILPVVVPKMDANKAGIFSHKTSKKLSVAVAVSIPNVILTNFRSPRILRDMTPICLKRLSRFSARVFSPNAVVAGISIKTCTLPVATVDIFNRDRSALEIIEMNSS